VLEFLEDRVVPSLINGGFETGNFSGWTQWGDTSFSGVDNTLNIPVHSGNFAAFFGPTAGLGGIRQTVSTIPGATYQLTLWLDHPFADTGTEFQVQVDGNILSDVVDPGVIDPYTPYTFTYTAVGSSATVQLGFYEAPAYFYLDDVSFEPVGVTGPYVVSTSLTGTVSGTVTDDIVTFNEPVDPNTFTFDQFNLTDPNGNPVNVNSITTFDDTTYDVAFDPQSALGTYGVSIGPNIADFSGNTMFASYTTTFTIAPSGTNLLVNGGFETGDFTGWTQWGDTSFSGVSSTVPVNSGSFAAFFGPTTSLGGIRQTVAATPGQSYTLTLWLDHPFGDTGTEFQVQVDGNILYDVVDPGVIDPYTPFAWSYTATSFTTTIQLGFYEAPAYFYLDDVSLTANPAPHPGGSTGGADLGGVVPATANSLAASAAPISPTLVANPGSLQSPQTALVDHLFSGSSAKDSTLTLHMPAQATNALVDPLAPALLNDGLWLM
jgi:hypothetical protein